MSDRTEERQRSIFPINLDKGVVSHPVIGDIIQREEDFEWVPLDDTPYSPLFRVPLYKPVASSSSEKPVMCLARHDRIAIDLWLHQNARRCSVVMPRELLTSDATTLFDIRLLKNAPVPIAKNILDTLQIIIFLLGDGIEFSWRGKTKHDPANDPAEKAYLDREREIAKALQKNEEIERRNKKKALRHQAKILQAEKKKREEKRKKKNRKRKNPSDEPFEEEAEEDEDSRDLRAEEEELAEKDQEEFYVPPARIPPPYSTDEELKTLYSFAGLTLTGAANASTFTVQKTGEAYPHSYSRVYMDIEHVYDNTKTEGLHQTTHLMSSEPLAYILHFTVLDPRISLLKGIGRLITRNTHLQDERIKKTLMRTDNILTLNSSAVQDEDFVVYNAREHSCINSITSWEQWRDWLARTSSRVDLVMTQADYTPTDAAPTTEMSYLDPFSTLNPRTLFSFHGQEKFQFDNIVPKNAGSTLQCATKNFITSTEFDFENNYTSNMTWVQETEYLLTYKINQHIIAANCNMTEPPLTTTKVIYRAYKNPYNVVRIFGRDLDHMVTLDSILPNYMKNAVKGNFYSSSSYVNPFPFDADVECYVRNHNITNKSRLAKGGADARIASHLTICDTIFSRYFDPSKTLKPVYRTLSEPVIIDELFRISIRALSNHAPNLPKGLKTIVKFHDDLRPLNFSQYSAGGIFPLFRSTFDKIPGLDHLTTPTDKFCDWFSHDYCEGPSLSLSHLHSLCMFLVFTVPLQFQRSETQSMILVMGPPGTGKSTLVDSLFKFNGIPNIMIQADSNSEMAFNSGANHDGGIQFTDDAGYSDPIFSNTAFGRNKTVGLDQSSQFKSRLTRGEITRQITQITQTGARVPVDIKTSTKSLFIKLSNHQVLWNCEEAILDRSYIFYAPISRRVGGFKARLQDANNTSLQNIMANKRTLTLMITRFQIFSAYIGYFIGCGAIIWNSAIHAWPFYLYWDRFLEVYKEIHGRELLVSSRFSSDRILSIVYACVVMRVWVEEGYSNGTVGLDSNIDSGFSFTVFKQIMEENRMVVRQEDFIRAMSFTEEMAPYRCYTYITKWLLRHLSKLGYNAVESTLEEGEYWKKIPNLFIRGVAEGFTGCTLSECQSDVNYLDLKIPPGSREEICSFLAEAIYSDYQRFFFDQYEIERYLNDHFLPTRKNKTTSGVHETAVYTVTENEPMITIPSMPMQVFKFVKCGEKMKIGILRAWVDDWMRDERSYFRDPHYNRNEDFITSPVYATLKHMFNFVGATTGTFALPGMNLSHLNETTSNYDAIRPEEMMKITVEPPNSAAARIPVGSSCADTFPDMCTRFQRKDGKPDAYFDPEDPSCTLDKFTLLRAESTKKFL